MAYDARVLRILIASPGDVQDERRIIAEIIYEWNYSNSRDKGIVLLPLRWETNTYPETGVRPQDAINRQIVDSCDMAIGVFWTRLGTPTGVAESGTEEEITRVADAGKPVMLYFSREKVELESTDLDEYARLREFKQSLQAKALVENYRTTSEFREKLRPQLSMRILDIVTSDSMQQDPGSANNPQISLAIAVGNYPQLISPSEALNLVRIVCTDREEIPDYGAASGYSNAGAGNTTAITTTYISTNFNINNIDYYRELVDLYCESMVRQTLWLAVVGSPEQSVRSIHLDTNIRSNADGISLNPEELSIPKPTTLMQGTLYTLPAPVIEQPSAAPQKAITQNISRNEWRLEIDIPIVQPQRTVISPSFLILKAVQDGIVVFEATTYSSDSRPFPMSLRLEVHVEERELSYKDILKQLIPEYNEQSEEPDAPKTESLDQ